MFIFIFISFISLSSIRRRDAYIHSRPRNPSLSIRLHPSIVRVRNARMPICQSRAYHGMLRAYSTPHPIHSPVLCHATASSRPLTIPSHPFPFLFFASITRGISCIYRLPSPPIVPIPSSVSNASHWAAKQHWRLQPYSPVGVCGAVVVCLSARPYGRITSCRCLWSCQSVDSSFDGRVLHITVHGPDISLHVAVCTCCIVCTVLRGIMDEYHGRPYTQPTDTAA